MGLRMASSSPPVSAVKVHLTPKRLSQGQDKHGRQAFYSILNGFVPIKVCFPVRSTSVPLCLLPLFDIEACEKWGKRLGGKRRGKPPAFQIGGRLERGKRVSYVGKKEGEWLDLWMERDKDGIER